MTAVRWLLITVTDPSPESRASLATLLASLQRQEQECDLVLVMRGGGGVPESDAVRVHGVVSPHRIALSEARNLALAHAASESLLEGADVVAFPDDDASYPDRLLARVAGVLGGGIAIACGPYAPDIAGLDRRRFPARPRALRPGTVMRVVSSNNVFLRGDVVRSVGRFDARFGLGARYGAGEDSDYVLRALRQGHAGVYDPGLVVRHPYKPHRPAQYYPGNVAVLARHARGGGTGPLLCRRLATGALMTARRRLALADYLEVVRSAAELVARDGAPELALAGGQLPSHLAASGADG